MAETVAVVLPPMGESVTEGTVVEWRKHPGDVVSEGETVADVTTDKVDVEIPAPATGVMAAIHAAEGQTVPVGALLAEILGDGEPATGAPAPEPTRAVEPAGTAEPAASVEPAGAIEPPGAIEPSDAVEPAMPGPTPVATREPATVPSEIETPATGGRTVEVTLPTMGESVTEGTISALPVAVGDTVSANQTIAEVTTDKVDVEVPAPAAGVITELRVAEGSTVPVGGVIAVLAASNGAGVAVPAPDARPASAAAAAPAPPAEPAAAPAPAPAAAGQHHPATAPAPGGQHPATPPAPPVEPTDPEAFHVSPLARRRAAIEHVDLAAVHGSGPGGQVRSADVAAALLVRSGAVAAPAPAAPAITPAGSPASAATPAPPAAPALAALAATNGAAPPTDRTPLRGPAAALAAAMEESREIPTATSFRTIEVGLLEARRRQLNDALKASGRDEKVSFTHLIGYAIALAAAEMPEMTAHFERDPDGGAVRVQPGVHLGLAVDTVRKDGSRFLVVPVIKRAADRDFQSFRAEYERLVALARGGRLGVDDMTGASIQLTNPGGLGTMASVPRLTRGTGTIIATGSIDHPPGLRGLGPERLREMGVGKVMTLTSTYDHRVIQGAQSGEFLGRIEGLLASGGFYARVFAALGVRMTAPPSVVATPSAPARTLGATRAAPSHELMAAVSAGMSLVTAYRRFGHLAANLDPLGSQPLGEESLDERRLGLTPELMRAIPADIFRTYEPGETLADIVPGLRATYCGTIAYQIEHLASHEQRLWLREHIESGWNRRPLAPERRLVLLGRLTKVEAMERYLRKAFLGQKTFSLEGLDAMVPTLEELVNVAAVDGITRIIMGMAHRGRLATITHVANRTYESVLVAFEQGEQRRLLGQEPDDPTGDVKYHLGADGTYLADNGTPVSVKIVNNPSHLEFVDPVVEGWVRAEQTTRTAPDVILDPHRALAVLIHGDAAFPGQGVVAETLNLSALHGYSVGGTVHVISNNQVGFTTDPTESRSTRYASDLAKGYDIPIIHVNADDVEACVQAMRLAYEYRRTFSRDVLVDLIGYRRYGHNETDEPAYTQPLMYERIKSHPTARELYAARLVADGLITEAQADAQYESAFTRVQQAHQRVKETMAVAEQERGEHTHESLDGDLHLPTGVSADMLRGILRQLSSAPEGFSVHRKLASQLKRREASVDAGGVDWATAESLAFGSLLVEGVPVRLAGQDTERGTFSQRHLAFHDERTGGRWSPMEHLVGATATFEVYNSPLSENGALGFEYGYSTAAPETLVLWEAQFGDFVNGAQVFVDQFISAGEAKWGNRSRLTLLLPHGYEGMGPEHSSARLERFLALSANGNWRVANLSTAAQYFHLLRSQALATHPRPLVIMTPKSLLRSPIAASRLDELSEGAFQPVLDDPGVDPARRAEVRTLLLCTGKIYHDLVTSPLRAAATRTAVARVEILDPLPLERIIEVVKGYPKLEQVFWVQEEPKNMGAWNHVNRPIGRMRPYKLRWDYLGRPRRASPSEGFHGAHTAEQERIVREALTIEATPTEVAAEAARCGSSL